MLTKVRLALVKCSQPVTRAPGINRARVARLARSRERQNARRTEKAIQKLNTWASSARVGLEINLKKELINSGTRHNGTLNQYTDGYM